MDEVGLSSLYGIGRGVLVQTVINPLNEVKIRMHVRNGGAIQISQDVFRREGVGGFYKGFPYQLAITCTKQMWVWPIISTMPRSLNERKIDPFLAQGITGFTIATIDTTISSPWDRKRIFAIFNEKSSKKKGWLSFYAKSQSSWISFLVFAKYFRGEKKHTIEELIPITFQVALAVSLVQAPFDQWNTRSLILSEVSKAKIFRAWPLSAVALLIQNFASLFLLNKIEG